MQCVVMCIFTGELILSADIDWVQLCVEGDAQTSEIFGLIWQKRMGWEPSSYFSEPGNQSQSGMIFVRTFKITSRGWAYLRLAANQRCLRILRVFLFHF